jgi:hypothetical protein
MQDRQMVLARLCKPVGAPVLVLMMNKAVMNKTVKSVMSQKTFFGMSNLPLKMDPENH